MDQKGKGKESNTSNFFFFGTQVILVTNRRSLHFLAVDPRHMIDYKILDHDYPCFLTGFLKKIAHLLKSKLNIMHLIDP